MEAFERFEVGKRQVILPSPQHDALEYLPSASPAQRLRGRSHGFNRQAKDELPLEIDKTRMCPWVPC